MRVAAILGRGLPAVLLAGLAFGPGAVRAGEADHPWPVAGGTPEHTASAVGPAPSYRTGWGTRLEDGRTPIAGPVVAADALIVPGRTQVLALDPGSGDELWSADRASGPGGPAAVGEDLVVFVEGEEQAAAAVAVRLDDGEEAWRTELDGPALGGVTIAEGSAYVGTTGGTVYAVGLEDGEIRWTAATGDEESEEGGPEEIGSTPAVGGGAVIVTAEDREERRGAVYAFEAESGERRWLFRPEGAVAGFSSPAVAGDAVVVGGGDLHVHALDLREGSPRWAVRSRAPFGSLHVPAVPREGILIGDVVGHVYRLDPETGEQRWVFRVPAFLLTGSVSVSDGTALVGDDGGQLSAIDIDRGVLVWKRQLGDRPVGAAAVAGERVFAAARSGTAVGLEHDPDRELLDEPSPTTVFPGAALLSYAAGFALVWGALFVVFRTVRARMPQTRGA